MKIKKKEREREGKKRAKKYEKYELNPLLKSRPLFSFDGDTSKKLFLFFFQLSLSLFFLIITILV
jgi:hypothetical protein